eukprot:356117-Chlamydomonas_euryale.AAC.1
MNSICRSLLYILNIEECKPPKRYRQGAFFPQFCIHKRTHSCLDPANLPSPDLRALATATMQGTNQRAHPAKQVAERAYWGVLGAAAAELEPELRIYVPPPWAPGDPHASAPATDVRSPMDTDGPPMRSALGGTAAGTAPGGSSGGGGVGGGAAGQLVDGRRTLSVTVTYRSAPSQPPASAPRASPQNYGAYSSKAGASGGGGEGGGAPCAVTPGVAMLPGGFTVAEPSLRRARCVFPCVDTPGSFHPTDMHVLTAPGHRAACAGELVGHAVVLAPDKKVRMTRATFEEVGCCAVVLAPDEKHGALQRGRSEESGQVWAGLGCGAGARQKMCASWGALMNGRRHTSGAPLPLPRAVPGAAVARRGARRRPAGAAAAVPAAVAWHGAPSAVGPFGGRAAGRPQRR